MEPLQATVGWARRRLGLQRFLQHLPWTCTATFFIALVGIVASKWWPLGLPALTWAYLWLGGALAVGVLGALVQTLFTREDELTAALEIDKRFRLNERVSSAMSLDAAMQATPSGQAVLADALGRLSRLEVREKFALSLDQRTWLPVLPLVLAVLAAMLLPTRTTPTAPAVASNEAVEKIEATSKKLQNKLEQQRAEAKKLGLEDADALLKQVEESASKLKESSSAKKEQALAKLNDLAKELKDRREQLATPEAMRQQLNQLKDIQSGPADKAAKAMQKGDFNEAKQQIEQLKQQLADGKLGDEAKQQAAKQLDQLKQAMQQAAEQHQQQKQKLEQAQQQAKQAGNMQQAQQLQEQLDKLNQQQPAMDQLAQMAQNCEACANAMKQGNAGQAQQALDQLGKQLQQMAQDQQELELLDRALDDMDLAKAEMAGDEGEFAQNMAGQGEGQHPGNKPGQQQGQAQPGKGIGKGTGQGEKSEELKNVRFFDSNVSQKVGQGAIEVNDFVPGANRRGEVTETIKSSFEAAAGQASDAPLAGQRLPRDYRDHAKEYFDALRKGTAE